ncbi:hypothetical protein [Actinoallomurus sp. CA-142502]|uniref:hypothetical protein n=1 Tax=Actinoallomurus sp. CA-142502 TaxID=3239885 RepID=UPI003D94C9BB
MSDNAPTRVALYVSASGTDERVAEFRWSPGSAVELTVFDPDWGTLAEQYYRRGVPLVTEMRTVPRSEAEAFMRALLEPRSMSYYEFVDESRPNSSGP